MKSGLGDRNNTLINEPMPGLPSVSMKSDLRDRNNATDSDFGTEKVRSSQ